MENTYQLNIQQKLAKQNRIKRGVWFFLISLTVIQQMPVIKELYYTHIRGILYFIFGIFSILSISTVQQFFSIHLVKYFTLTIFYSFFLFVIVNALGVGEDTISEFLIPFGILLCSINTKFHKDQLGFILIWYVLISVILGTSSIYYYGEGFTITRNYFLLGKNQIGPLLGISTIITGIWIFNKKQIGMKHINLLLKMGIFLLLLTSILIIRNRSGLVGIVITLTLALVMEYKLKRNIRNLFIAQVVILILVVLLLMGIFDGLIDALWKSLTFNYDIYDINSLSAGRTDIYKFSLQYIRQYPIFGQLGMRQFLYSTPHNYVLNKWVSYGILGSMPIVLFYLYLWFFTINGMIRARGQDKFSLPLWALLFSLVVSNFEYTYPYGPGVAQIMVWFMVGQYLRQQFVRV